MRESRILRREDNRMFSREAYGQERDEIGRQHPFSCLS
jgi:hypothetical protein